MNFENKYNFKITENLKSDFFDKKSFSEANFTILMPPPNITGNLHLGHSLDLVIQDFIVRSQLLLEKKLIFWITGFDHAGIATQSKIENLNLSLNKEEKIQFALNKWYPQQKIKFKEQWSNLGLLLDYNQDNFTMNPDVQNQVRDYFIALYNDKLIYQSTKIVNWDPKLQTVVSDIEVDHIETDNILFYIEYQIFGSNEKIIVATSRPETIFADVALFVNPSDLRFQKYINYFALNPLTGNKIPILRSSKVDINFGSGVLKCTPGHDFVDYELAKEFDLPLLSCYDVQGNYNYIAKSWEGKNFRDSKFEIIEYLKLKSSLLKQETYKTKTPYSQRSGAIIDPTISIQWFLNLPLMVKKI